MEYDEYEKELQVLSFCTHRCDSVSSGLKNGYDVVPKAFTVHVVL